MSQHHQVKTHISSRIISLGGDIETNPGPLDHSINPEQPMHSVSLLETRLSHLGTIPLDIGGCGDCFFASCIKADEWHSKQLLSCTSTGYSPFIT